MFNIKNIGNQLIAIWVLPATMATGCGDNGSSSLHDDVDIQETNTPAPPTSVVSDRPKLSVRIREDKTDADKRIADIVFTKPTDAGGPRVAEIYLKYSDGLTYLSSIDGPAIDKAGKTLVVQNPEDGRLRLVIYGADNVNTIDGGILASVIFESDTQNTNTLEILTNRPVFAPSRVNDGLLVADPVTFE